MAIDLSLDRIKTLLEHLPSYDRPTVHIAGTNGKGSVAAIVSSIFSAAKISVGRFTSPHLLTVRDCITLNGALITESDYSSARDAVTQIDNDCGSSVSSFELLTCVALYVFQRAMVDVVVLEVGMGGRLDATNAIPDSCVLVSALTAVDLDHQAFLGNTAAEIAAEKAAIARRNKPFVLGPQMHPEAAETATDVAKRIGAKVILAPPALNRERTEVFDGALKQPEDGILEPNPQPVLLRMPCFESPVLTRLPLHGDHQLINLGIATSIVSTIVSHPACVPLLPVQQKLSPSIIAEGVSSAQWPGRLSFHRVDLAKFSPAADREDRATILVDGAHNPASAATLAAFLLRIIPSHKFHVAFVLSLSHSPPKTPLQTLSPLLSFRRSEEISISVAALGFSPVDGMPWVKPVSPIVICEVAHALCSGIRLWRAPDAGTSQVVEALRWSSSEVTAHGGRGIIVLAGSLYLLADFYRAVNTIGVV